MKRVDTRAIIIRRINFGEADRILTVITPDLGKVSLLAKGARRSKSKLAGGLELFCVTNITYIDGKSDLKTVISARLENFYSKIIESVDVTMAGYEAVKLVSDKTDDQCESDFFDLLNQFLESLNSQQGDLPLKSTWLHVRLLDLLGGGVNLEQQSGGEPFEEDVAYTFDYDNMGFTAHKSGKYTAKHIKIFRLLGKVSKPENLLKVDGAEQLGKDLLPLLKQCMQLQ